MTTIRWHSSRVLKKYSTLSFQPYTIPKLAVPIKNDSFHESVGLVLTIGQCFAQIPIVGVLHKNYRNARFQLFSFRTLHTTVFIVLGFCEGCLTVKRTYDLDFNIGSVQNVLFIIVCMLSAGLLLSLARKWNALICFWQEHESVFLRAPYTIDSMRLKTKINLVAILFLILAFVEHLLSMISAATYDYKQYTMCKIKDIRFVHFWLLKERSHIFLVIPFHNVYVLPTLWLGLTMAFSWNYVDLMIIVVGIGITTRFDQINSRLKASIKTTVNDTFWSDIREHYVHIVDILQKVDNEISLLVLLSCASNLYYICLQLFYSFTPIPFFLSTVYFWYSLIFLIGRTLSVLLFSAEVHDASRKSISLLRNIPSKLWTSEAQRFLDLVTAECHALSGKRFFYLTKTMILAMAGTVVTYELVLLNEVEEEPDRKSLCNITKFNFSSYN